MANQQNTGDYDDMGWKVFGREHSWNYGSANAGNYVEVLRKITQNDMIIGVVAEGGCVLSLHSSCLQNLKMCS
jgi:hypothetical protein